MTISRFSYPFYVDAFILYHLEYLLTTLMLSACHILRQINAFLGFIKQLKATTAKI
jgi:hypothetical protein